MQDRKKTIERDLNINNFNLFYVIVGKDDGSWEVQAFDAEARPNGAPIQVQTPGDAWRLYMMLNGYSYECVQFLGDVGAVNIADLETTKTERIA